MLVLAFSPAAFGAPEQFNDQVDWLARACLNATPIPGRGPVRLPGQLALSRKDEALTAGLTLYLGIEEALRTLGDRFGIDLPAALA